MFWWYPCSLYALGQLGRFHPVNIFEDKVLMLDVKKGHDKTGDIPPLKTVRRCHYCTLGTEPGRRW